MHTDGSVGAACSAAAVSQFFGRELQGIACFLLASRDSRRVPEFVEEEPFFSSMLLAAVSKSLIVARLDAPEVR